MASKVIHISSKAQFDELLKSSRVVIADCMLPACRDTCFCTVFRF